MNRRIGTTLVALCMLVQNPTAFADDGAAAISENYLLAAQVTEFAPKVGKDNDGYSQFNSTAALTNGKKDSPWGAEVWYVKFPSKSKGADGLSIVPSVSFKASSAEKVNAVKLYYGTGTKNNPTINDRVDIESVSIYTKSNAGDDWVQASIQNRSEYTDETNVCNVALFELSSETTVDEIKIQIAKGTGNLTGKDTDSDEAFRIREAEMYYDGSIVPVTPEPKPEPEPEPDPDIPWEGVYDYDVNNSVIFNLPADRISVSSGELTVPGALVDGKSTSASGNGGTKWFVQKPTGDDYAEFTLSEPKAVAKAVVCSGNLNNTTPTDIIDSFDIQYADENGDWVTAATLADNTQKVAQISFKPVIAKKFRLHTSTETRFRIREVQLEYPEIRAAVSTDEFVDITDGADAVIRTKGSTDKNCKITLSLNGAEVGEVTVDNAVKIYRVKITPDAAGKCTLGIFVRLENEESGEYELIGTAETHFTALDIKGAINRFNGSKVANIEEIIGSMCDAGFEITRPSVMGDGVYKKLAESLDDSYSEDIDGMKKLCDDINAKLPLAVINGAKSGAELLGGIKSYGEIYGITDSDFITKLDDNIAADACMIVMNARTDDFASYEDFRKNIPSACALAEYNATYYTSLPQIFAKYASVCAVDISGIEQKYLDKTLSVLKSNTVQNYNDIPQLLAAAYEQAKAETPSAPAGGGGGSSGRGSSGGTSFSAPVTKPPQTDVTRNTAFSDLSEAQWARDAIESLANDGIVGGDGDGKFRPNDAVSRAEFVKMAVLVLGLTGDSKKCGFADVSESDWYCGFAAAASDAGIITGDEKNMFRGGDNISRQDMAVIVYRMCLLKNISLDGTDKTFDDENRISDYAKKPIMYLCRAGLINGVGSEFMPDSPATRAQTAAMLARVKNVVEIQEGD